MNIILIIGHESSHYKDLEQILYAHGMAKAMPSHTHQITPIELNEKFLSHRKIPKKVRDNLSFDLFKTNDTQTLWGWADTNAINLLEYWANFDKNIFFILAYDTGESILNQIDVNTIEEVKEELIQEKIKKWISYNQELVNFYKKYPKRCLLINGEQSLKFKDNFINFLSKKINANISSLTIDENINLLLPYDANNIKFSNNIITSFYMQKLLQDNDAYTCIFTNMQNLADIPLSLKEESSNSFSLLKKSIQQQIDLKQKNIEIIKMQQQLVNNQNESNLVISQLHFLQEEIEKFYIKNQEFQSIKKTIENLSKTNQTLKKQVTKQEIELQRLTQEKQNSCKENSLLISQLHKIQEEIEKIYFENQNLKLNQQKKKIEPTKKSYYGAADRIKQDLPYRLGYIIIYNSKSVKNLLMLPYLLIKEYQNFQNEQQNNNSKNNLPLIEEYQDFYEAEKVQNHLSYKLGKLIADSIQSPKNILKLPLNMSKEILNFKKLRK